MHSPLVAEVEELLLLCAHAVRLRSRDPRSQREIDRVLAEAQPRLALILTLISRKLALAHGGVADITHPGYIRRTIAGTSLLVPFHLFDALPESDSTLAELIGLAQKIRISADSTVCLSGSGLMYGQLRSLSDIDFCEYVADEPHAALGDFLQRLSDGDPESLACVSAWVASASERVDIRPDSRRRSPRAARAIASCRAAKFDFVTQTHAEGIVEVTNLAFFLQGDVDGGFRRSHPLQEAPLGSTWVPRDLSNPWELGEYINFLLDDTQNHVEGDVESLNKAGKRSYALARLLFRARDAEEINAELTACDVFVRTAISSRLRARERLQEAKGASALHTALAAKSLLTIRDLCSRASEHGLRELSEYAPNGEDGDRAWLTSVRNIVAGPVRRDAYNTIQRFAQRIASAVQ